MSKAKHAQIQKKLDQETFNPVFTVFLMILLRISGLFDGFEDAEPESEENSSIPAMDRAVGTDLSVAIRQAMVAGESYRTTLGERFMTAMMDQRREEIQRERMRDHALNVPGGCGNVTEDEYHGEDLGEWRVGNANDCERTPLPTVSAFNPRRPNDWRRFDELTNQPIHEQADEVHIDLGALGAAVIPVPEGAQSLEVDPRTFTIQWTMQDSSVQPMYDLRDFMTSLPRRQMGGFFDWGHAAGYCTPSRRPLTGRDRNGRLQSFRDIGHFTFSDGSPVSYGIDHNGRAVMLEQGDGSNLERGDGPNPGQSRHVGPTVVGRCNDGRLVLMGSDGVAFAEGERGDGPSLE